MKREILDRIKELGGKIEHVQGNSLQEDLLSISFDTVLYPRPTDTPWSTAEDQEPIYGMGEFVDENRELFHSNKQAFFDKLLSKYFCITEEGYGQTFWMAQLFTPYKKGTADFKEWYADCFDELNLEEIRKIVDDPKPDFIQLFYAYSFPDHYYICLSDPNPENPTVFGTDHEVFFDEISIAGNLEEFLKRFMTTEEVVELVEKALENQ